MNFRCCGYHHYGEYLDYIKLLVAAVTQTAPRPFCSAPAAAGRRRMHDIYLYGSWSKDQNDFRRNRTRVYVLKTLNCDKESYLAIGMLVNLICYYANEFISKHMDHFD